MSSPHRLIIVGGVAAGMSAAMRARRLNEQAHITVYEAGPYVSFANCGLPYHVGGEIEDRDKLLLHTPQSLKQRGNLDVRINHSVTAIDPEAQTVTVTTPSGEKETAQYDSLILAPGASEIVPPVPGAEKAFPLRTIDQMDAVIERANNILASTGENQPKAVVIGAGFIGLETVEALSERGFDVSVVDLVDHVLPPLDPDLAPYLEDALKAHGVNVITGVSAKAITGEDSFVVELSDGQHLQADLIIMSVGVKPRSELAVQAGLEVNERGAIIVDENQRTSDPHIWAAGDVTAVTFHSGRVAPVMLAGPANRQGRRAADSVMGHRVTPVARVMATATVRVFDQVAAITGTGRRELDAAGVDYETIRIHAPNHVTYFPGAETIHLMGFFERSTGRLLGAQAVGRSGAPRRIDVLVTAIRAGMTADDLAELELCYSPPIGAAKDPINMMGFVAQNALDGTCPQWQPEDLDAIRDENRGIILDVRSAKEHERFSIPGALNIPLPELRDNLGAIDNALRAHCAVSDEEDLDRSQTTIYVHCATGPRSYLATRILIGNGYKALNLAGGANSIQAHMKATKQ
ncbi:MAG: FAD-dependent oxidoreductase [Actinomycetaceae bacterium]|nr:FAD-dependent oxidoreductase [Actinomycetaceae bacterium]